MEKRRLSELMRGCIEEGVREAEAFITRQVVNYSKLHRIDEPMLCSALVTAIKHSLAMHASVAAAMASSMTLEELEQEIADGQEAAERT